MSSISTGQCGLCTHFGEEHADAAKLVQIHSTLEAPADFLDSCGHPKLVSLHLKVSAVSGCDGFTPVAAA